MGRHDGKRVLITGGTSGIGLTTAQMLVDEGARVLVTGRTPETIHAAQQQLGDSATVFKSEAASLAENDLLADRVREELGGLDLLFLNAGITRWTPFEEMSEEDYDEIMAINTKGPYFTVQRLAPLLVGGSSVVLTTSVVNVLGFPLVSAYAASKAALRSMARSLARELADRDIRVNAVSPGVIDTTILEKATSKDASDQTKDQVAASNPMKRIGRPDEIAKAVLFLAFDATYTTGVELPVDGGATQL